MLLQNSYQMGGFSTNSWQILAWRAVTSRRRHARSKTGIGGTNQIQRENNSYVHIATQELFLASSKSRKENKPSQTRRAVTSRRRHRGVLSRFAFALAEC